jgi:multiple sugar transport system ATP-binding protein
MGRKRMAVVELRNIQKYFGDVCAVDNVTLTVEEGEFLVLVGPSGSGKTTLLRMIAGLEQPSDGEIRIAHQVVNHVPPRLRKIAMVFQSYALYPHMTVYDNIAFPLKTEKMNKQAIQQKVTWAAGILKISHLLQRKPNQLSGGERQRAALARALVRDPEVFLLDEPLASLDVKLRALAREELRQFQRQMKVTTIFVTHDQTEAMSMGDRIAVLADGRLHQLGTPNQLYREPADTFVASFLGTPPMNLIETDDAILGFHPEHFQPQGTRAEVIDPLAFPFTVARVEYLGSERYVYGSVPSIKGKVDAVSKLPASISQAMEIGHTYNFEVDPANLVYFNRRTNLRMGAPTRVMP